MEYVFGYLDFPNFTGGALYQTGSTVHSTFSREGMVGWEAGLMINRSGYFSIPPILDEDGGQIGWDYQNKVKIRDWYIQLPVSLTFNMFEGTGFLLGARINRRLTNLDTYNEYFRKWIPAAHLGIFTHLSPRIRIDLTGFLDLPARYDLQLEPDQKLREVGGSVNIRYTIK